MKWLWSLLGLLPIYIAYRQAKKSRDTKKAMIGLQFWSRDFPHDDDPDDPRIHITVHFPSMLLYYRALAATWDKLRLFHIQRKADGAWEMKLTDRSWAMDLKQKEHVVSSGTAIFMEDAKKELARMKVEGNRWIPMGYWQDSSLEIAYQRFVHAKEVPLLELNWEQHEEAQEVREN